MPPMAPFDASHLDEHHLIFLATVLDPASFTEWLLD